MSRTKKTRNDSQDWDTARDAVRDNATELSAMTSHLDLLEWAKAHGIDTGSLFAKFKAELRKQLHIDYDAVRQRTCDARWEQMRQHARSVAQIVLYAAGDGEVASFAVCSADGEDPWYGDFHDNDNVAADDQDAADIAAARKAIYLAGQARTLAQLDVIGLRLVVSNHRVTTDTVQRDCLRHDVFVSIDVVDDDEDNPALQVCRLPGFRGWRDVSLTDLLTAADHRSEVR
ncbi:hypothetical protein [Gordonia rhizosphera]|uniref:Uncharacterized protein n=1 Tax=Gordonia rhizosphera NBRC 16068 TaxID=1108045 RepID=K6X3T1_9ACTN|nr:hypothetical protein [Gordonia rhizosphera]GAB93459.1 hypothetical protein GORHZ_222_00140 [Gordonia rhizosphera NBRC 16068]